MLSKKQGQFPEVKKEHDAFGGEDAFGSSSDTNDASQDSANNTLGGPSQELTDDASSDEYDEDVKCCENAPNQIVVYNPETGDTSKALSVLNHQQETLPKFAESNHSTRILPSVGEFAVQCASCFKWRLIPTKEKYQELRQNIKEEPFVCETAREWRPNVSCDDPADISQDGSRIWAIDKPSISQPPTGWKRSVRIRGEGSTRFADVYYVAPTGKTLRSKVEIQKYLIEHPEFMKAGVNMSQFSFQIPKPLQENYVRKRTYKREKQQCDATALAMLSPPEPAEVSPLSWAGPAQSTDLPLVTRPDSSLAPYLEAPDFDPVGPPLKKQATGHPRPTNDRVKVEQPQQAQNAA